jgi:hypothetical protein
VYVKKNGGIRGVKTSGHEKTPYTTVLAFCTNGIELPPLLLYKRKIMPSIKIQRGIVIHIHMKGRSTGQDGEALKTPRDRLGS